jgi:serine/threonine protein kinase
MIGETIGHYRITEKLGEGAMGVVYKAEDAKLRRIVALKFLSAGAKGNSESAARFVREAQAAGKLNHPNICTVFGLEEEGEHTFMVMSFVEGGPLSSLLRKSSITTDRALDLAIQIGEGLTAAHKSGVVHRDIKAANVMVTPEGQAKITDFGLALLTDRSRLTKAGALMGTVAYMSPEQALGKDVDHRTDLWSLGVLLFEMLIGRRPFDDNKAHKILQAIVNEAPPSIGQKGSHFWLEMDRIIHKALSKKPAERYQHADDFVVDLRAVARNVPAVIAVSTPSGSGSRPDDAALTATVTMLPDGSVRIPVVEKTKRSPALLVGAGAGAALAALLAWRIFGV